MRPTVKQKKPSSKKGKGAKPMRYLILLTFLVSLLGCAGTKVVTEKAIRDIGKDLQPGQRLIYRRITVEETFEIIKGAKEIYKVRPPMKKEYKEEDRVRRLPPPVKKYKERKEGQRRKAHFYQISK